MTARKKRPRGGESAGPESSRTIDKREAITTDLLGAIVEAVAERTARRVVDLMRSGTEIDLVDQHDSPLGPRRHVALCRKGVLPHVRIGRRWCVRRSDLEQYMRGEAPAAEAANDTDHDPDAELAAELGLRVVK